MREEITVIGVILRRSYRAHDAVGYIWLEYPMATATVRERTSSCMLIMRCIECMVELPSDPYVFAQRQARPSGDYTTQYFLSMSCSPLTSFHDQN